MRFVAYREKGSGTGAPALGILNGERLFTAKAGGPTDLTTLLAAGGDALEQAGKAMLAGTEVDLGGIDYLPPFPFPEKILCVGLNYREHAAESGFKEADYPALFGRFPSSLIGHQAPIIRPKVSDLLDFEGELVVIIGKSGRNVPKERALEYVAGYSVFNDGSIRDYQFKSAQWMIGKNFDGTGAFGPAFVTADELPAGAKGLHLETRLNGAVMQSANTTDMIFDAATLVSLLSDACELKAGDVIVAGTPSGVGAARDPKIFMKPGDVCEIEVEGIGLLSNPIAQQA